MRRAAQQDELYRYVAQELAEPSICDEIPWSVESPGGFFIAPSYERSNCYAFIAGRTKNPTICWQVRRLGSVSLLSQQTSMWSCFRDAWRGFNGGIAVSPENLVAFFAKLGYDPDTLDLEGITPPVVSVSDVYRQLAARPGVVTRVERALEGSADRDPMNAAYLADLAALAGKTPRWCARIPEDLPLAGQAAQFRDWCYFTLASNTKNRDLCSRIPIRPQETDARLSLRAQCERQSNSPNLSGQYGPEVPADDTRTRALILLLNYEVPRAKDLPLASVAAACGHFLHALNDRADPRHAAARQRFLARVHAS